MGNSLVVQWLGLQASTAGDPGSIPGWETKIPQLRGTAKKLKRKKKGDKMTVIFEDCSARNRQYRLEERE